MLWIEGSYDEFFPCVSKMQRICSLIMEVKVTKWQEIEEYARVK